VKKVIWGVLVSVLLLTLLMSGTSCTKTVYITITPTATPTPIPTPNIWKALVYLSSGFSTELGLVWESPDTSDLQSHYYLVSDNLWAMFAMQICRPDIAKQIESKLKNECATHGLPSNSDGLPISYAHEAVIGEPIPIPFHAAHEYTVESVPPEIIRRGPGEGIIMRTAYDGNETIEDWQQYADLLCYAAISRYYEGNFTEPLAFFDIAKGMWDGKGIADKPFSDQNSTSYHEYRTYKLGLLLYTSNVLGTPLEFKGELLNRLWLQQAENGGFITGYNVNGVPQGSTNTETTSIVLISLESLGCSYATAL
jgi:hypothetical protein